MDFPAHVPTEAILAFVETVSEKHSFDLEYQPIGLKISANWFIYWQMLNFTARLQF